MDGLQIGLNLNNSNGGGLGGLGGLDLGYITELNSSDVLFGRGSGPNDHEGNIRFRQLVAERKAEYLATNHRQTKATIAREIVNTILQEQGRFLKKVEHFEARRLGIPKGVDAWVIVDDDTIMEKAKQALRQNTNKGKASSSSGASCVLMQDATSGTTSKAKKFQQQQQQHHQEQVTDDFLEPVPLPTGSSSPQHGTAAVAAAAAAGLDVAVEPTPLGVGSVDVVSGATAAAAAGPGGGGGGDRGSAGGGLEPTPLDEHHQNNKAMKNIPTRLNAYNNNMSMGPPARRGCKKEQFLSSQQNPLNQRLGDQIDFIVEKPMSRNNSTMGTMGDISIDDMSFNARRDQSMDIRDLESSFSRLRAGGAAALGTTSSGRADSGGQRYNPHESVETMGTIEPLGQDSTNMSYASMNSSTFSIFKSMGESTEELPLDKDTAANIASSNPVLVAGRGDSARTDSDFNVSDIWGSRRSSLLERLIAEERAEAAADAQDLAQDPRRGALLEEDPDSIGTSGLGVSSMSLVGAAFEPHLNSNQPGGEHH